jgi:hypothetical protein
MARPTASWLALQFFQHFLAEFIAVAVSKRDAIR